MEDPVEFRPPLPPEDRIWRHPSEVAADATRPPTVGAGVRSTRGRSTAALVVGSALIGATLSIGVIAALGGFDRDTRVVERQVAVQPVTTPAADAVAAITDRTAPSVAGVYVDRGDSRTTGSALVLRSDGYLLTNRHLVAGADAVNVRVQGTAMLPAEIVGDDETTDLAVLRVDEDGLHPAAVGSAESVRVGDGAMAIGHAGGGRWSTSVDELVISALDQKLRTPSGAVLHGMILLDTPLTADAAGGPLVDSSGAVIGITSAVPAAGDDANDPAAGAQGVATPIDVAVDAADDLIAFGRVRHVWLGVEGIDLPPDRAVEIGVSGGAEVASVVPDSPAAVAGMEDGDVIVAVDREPVASMSELIAALRAREPGATVALTVRRGGDEVVVDAVLEERTAD